MRRRAKTRSSFPISEPTQYRNVDPDIVSRASLDGLVRATG
jgi:hypothetical protein